MGHINFCSQFSLPFFQWFFIAVRCENTWLLLNFLAVSFKVTFVACEVLAFTNYPHLRVKFLNLFYFGQSMLDHNRILARVRNVSKIFYKCLQMFTNLRQQIQVVCLMHLEYLQLLVALLVLLVVV